MFSLTFSYSSSESTKIFFLYLSGKRILDISLSTVTIGHLGGDLFDERIVDWLAENFKRNEGIELLIDKQALQRLTETAERAKI
ncbi:unnamed protein product [Coffea canephora]|uniref:Uncharacterized protein n=1 Tax=Coffea canephora TaxID=49390 RepID=A0A068VAY4_COFCA|nr:unnamed protein product [Coffea canephora]